MDPKLKVSSKEISENYQREPQLYDLSFHDGKFYIFTF